MRSFASDNNSSVHPSVLQALAEVNVDHAFGYGEDPWTEKAIEMVQGLFERECRIYFVFNGTGSNTMALQAMTRPYHFIYTAETGHIAVDECGAPAKATGCMVKQIRTSDGKLRVKDLEPLMVNFGVDHHSQPGAVYISQCSELGTIYTPEEVQELCDFSHRHGMKVHMDGARISNAAVALGCTLDELSGAAGVDSLTLGGTKNGLMGAECVVVFEPTLWNEARFARKQACQLASKSRYLAAQYIAFLRNELWKENATKANERARELVEGLKEFPEVHFTQECQANQLFFTLPPAVAKELEKHYHFYYWNESIHEVRLVTSWDTTTDDVQQLLAQLTAILH